MTSAPERRRACFQLRIRPDLIDEYRERHRAVWPDMLAALSDAGWHNYSLFLREDGYLIGYVETDDFEAAQRRMAETEVDARWQAEMSRFFIPDAGTPTTGLIELTEVFHLEDQLAAATQEKESR